jgi:hypothetical protein
MTPTARTLQLLRRRGYLAAVAERFIQPIKRRVDLFNCIDIVAIHREETGVLGVQATTTSNLSARLRKAVALPALRTWLAAGNRFELWGWSKRGRRWKPKIISIRLPDLARVVIEAPPRRRGGRKWEALPLFPDGAEAG